MRTVVVVALHDVIAFDLATPVEVFSRVRLPDGRPGYRVVVAGEAREVSAGPLGIATEAGLEAIDGADLVVVPGRNDYLRPTSQALLDAIRAAKDRHAQVASICVGSFSLAEAGVLDGHASTTHWKATQDLARLYPGTAVDPDVLFTDDTNVLTSAGASAGLDLCLHIVRRDYGVAVAADAARLAVAPLHRIGGQAQFIHRNPTSIQTPSLERVLEWIEAHAHEPLRLDDIAAAAGVSVRTVSRKFTSETGQSPLQWVAGVRIRQAQELLETTDDTIDRISGRVGFASPSNFRSQFAAALGVTPGAYRRTFRPVLDAPRNENAVLSPVRPSSTPNATGPGSKNPARHPRYRNADRS